MHELKRNAVQICNELVAVTDERYLFYATEIFWEGEAPRSSPQSEDLL